MFETQFSISFRCYYEKGTKHTTHIQTLKLADIPKWIDCYKFTHPNCEAISAKVWFSDLKEATE